MPSSPAFFTAQGKYFPLSVTPLAGERRDGRGLLCARRAAQRYSHPASHPIPPTSSKNPRNPAAQRGGSSAAPLHPPPSTPRPQSTKPSCPNEKPPARSPAPCAPRRLRALRPPEPPVPPDPQQRGERLQTPQTPRPPAHPGDGEGRAEVLAAHQTETPWRGATQGHRVGHGGGGGTGGRGGLRSAALLLRLRSAPPPQPLKLRPAPGRPRWGGEGGERRAAGAGPAPTGRERRAGGPGLGGGGEGGGPRSLHPPCIPSVALTSPPCPLHPLHPPHAPRISSIPPTSPPSPPHPLYAPHIPFTSPSSPPCPPHPLHPPCIPPPVLLSAAPKGPPRCRPVQPSWSWSRVGGSALALPTLGSSAGLWFGFGVAAWGSVVPVGTAARTLPAPQQHMTKFVMFQ